MVYKQFLKERNIHEPFFFFADTFIPTWWTQYPDKKPLLAGWLAGPDSYRVSQLTEDEFLKESFTSLADIFNIPVNELQKNLIGFKVYNWNTDPFCRGGYSYAKLSTKRAIDFLKTPLENTIYFSGEAFAKTPSATVDAAFESGEEVAELVLGK